MSSVFDICTFLLNWYRYGIRSASSSDVPRAQTDWFIEGAMTQLFIIHLLRTGKIPILQSRASFPVVATTTTVGAIAMAVPYIPKLNKALSMGTPVPEYYGFLAAIIVGYGLLVHIAKTVYQRIFKEWL